MTALASEITARLTSSFYAHRDSGRAAAMSAYVRNLFPFVGIPTPARRAMTREALGGLARPSQADLTTAADALWALDEREYQYAAADLLSRYQGVCTLDFFPAVERLITTKSWWDTVDGLASNVVGPLVSRNPELNAEMDHWIGSDNIWLARTALLYQLRYKGATDTDRLFRYCQLRAAHTDFFIRKAIGWALREYSKTAPEVVSEYVARHAELSPLSRREALLWLIGGRRKPQTEPTSDPPV